MCPGGIHRQRRWHWEWARSPEAPARQVHLQHYVLTPELNQGYPHTYLEGADLAERTGASGRVILRSPAITTRGPTWCKS